MGSVRTIAAALALAAGCAPVPPPAERLPAEVAAFLERRGLGPDALHVIGNLVRHGPPAPRGAPALVVDLLARPLDALDAAEVFRRTVPAVLGAVGRPTEPRQFDALLKVYLDELTEAHRLLGSASKPFDEDLVLRQLTQGLPQPGALLAVADAVDAESLRRANTAFIDATARFARDLHGVRAISWKGMIARKTGTRQRTRDRHARQRCASRSRRRAAAGIRVLIDPGGNDEYRGSDLALHGFSAIVDLVGKRPLCDGRRGPGRGDCRGGAADRLCGQ